MKNSEEKASWTDEAIAAWTPQDITLQAGVSLEKIQDFERLLGFKFPQDFIELYSRMNGFKEFDWNENMFSLWSLERILKEFQEDGDTGYIGLCDLCIMCYTIGFHKSDGRIYKYHNDLEEVPIADNFKDFIVLLNTNDDLLY